MGPKKRGSEKLDDNNGQACSSLRPWPHHFVRWSRPVVDEELARLGGSATWSYLRNVLVARYLRDAPEAEISEDGEELLYICALASIPKEYLSRVDSLVRLQRVGGTTPCPTPSPRKLKRQIKRALEAAGGMLSWEHLRNEFTEQFDGDKRLLGLQLVASIPTEYLSKEDEMVRLEGNTNKSNKRACSVDSSVDSGSTDRHLESDAKRLKTQQKTLAAGTSVIEDDTKAETDPWAEKYGRLELVGDKAPLGTEWRYPLRDINYRSFVGHLSNALSGDEQDKFFEVVKNGVDWIQTGPRKTAWLVKSPCNCDYGYGGFTVPAKQFPVWMWDVLGACMPLCGLQDRAAWPNSCNLNYYSDGWGSVGWHADDEHLFQGVYKDCLIISLSLGQARTFSVRTWCDGFREESLMLKGGDLCTMEGMCQKYYQHTAPKEYDAEVGPRINLTWRWIVAHGQNCVLSE